MEHSDSCKEFTKSWEEKKQAYEELWGKNWCKKCHGWGIISYSDDPSPAGVSLAPGRIDYEDPCSCVEAGVCPRCGATTLNEDGTHCHTCDWDYDESEGLDPEPECECWYEEMNWWYRG